MREAIENAPRDGSAIIMEDDAKGAFAVAHWSSEAGEWVAENGEPIRITPSHWCPMPGDKRLPLKHDGLSRPQARSTNLRVHVTGSIAAALVAAAMFGAYFRAEVATVMTRYDGQQEIDAQDMAQIQLPTQDSRTSDLLALPRLAEASTHTANTAQDHLSLEEEHARSASVARELATARRELEVNVALLSQARDDATEFKQAAERITAELQQERESAKASLEANAALLSKARDDATEFKQAAEKMAEDLQQERESAKMSSRELAAARRELEANVALLNQARDEATQFKQAAEKKAKGPQQERESAEVSSRELATARRKLEVNVALLSKARDGATEFKQAAERITAELQQERESAKASLEANAALLRKARDDATEFKQAAERMTKDLQQERESAEASSRELATARRELEANVALLNQARDEATQFRQTTERMTTELQQGRESDKASAPGVSIPHETTQGAIGPLSTRESTANSQLVLAAAPGQPPAVVSQDSPDVARLMVRARVLLGQGNIGAARIVLEHAAGIGSAQANFMLAETYDPDILTTWGTYGTRGEAIKARELYEKAQAGGILEAKESIQRLALKHGG